MRGLVWLAVILLAGCTDPLPCAPPVEAGSGEPIGHEGGQGKARYTVYVLDAFSGVALPGADVTVLWTRDASPDCGDLECALRVQADHHPRERIPLVRMDLRTDATGRAVAHVPAERAVKVTATSDGYTEEWTPVAGPTRGGQIALALFPLAWNATFEGELPADVGARPNPVLTDRGYLQSHAMRVAGDGLSASDFSYRSARYAVSMTWTLPLLASVDLGLGWGENEQAAERVANTRQVVSGTHTESFDSGLRQDDEDPTRYETWRTFFIGPYLEQQFVSLEPVTYRGEVVVEFDHRRFAEADCGVLLPDAPIEAYAPDDELHNDARDVPAYDAPWPVALAFMALLFVAWRRR